MKFCKIGLVVLLCLVGMAIQAQGEIIASRIQGANSLPSAQPDYDWWYGCSPTSAGMLMGHYDLYGYDTKTYDNLVPGGDAEEETYSSPDSGTPTKLANMAIASAGHIADFWGTTDPLASGRTIPSDFDCLADFMGTNQGSMADGATSFTFFTSGAKFTAAHALSYGVWSTDGMYGVGEYVTYATYGYGDLYTQLTDNDGLGYGFSGGFSFTDFQNEINNDRGVLIHVEGHTMYGYGYDDSGNVLLHDTWSQEPSTDPPGPHKMTWGGAYSGLNLWGVTVLELTGGDTPRPDVPEPASVIIWAMIGGLGIGASSWRRRRQA